VTPDPGLSLDDQRAAFEAEYQRGFRRGLDLRPTKIGLLMVGIAIGLVAGILIGRSTVLAASRPASVTRDPVSMAGGTDRWRTEAPQGVSASAVAADPTAAAPTSGTIDPLCSPRPCPTLTPAALIRSGLASTYGPGWDGWLAWPDGPGWRLRICGAGGCRTLVSNDAGPDLERQRHGVVIDLDVPTFEGVCGVPWRRGHCPVNVTVMGRG
jgi:hypothetical protein